MELQTIGGIRCFPYEEIKDELKHTSKGLLKNLKKFLRDKEVMSISGNAYIYEEDFLRWKNGQY